MLMTLAASAWAQSSLAVTPLTPLLPLVRQHDWQSTARVDGLETDAALRFEVTPPLIQRIPGLSGRRYRLTPMPDLTLPPSGRVPTDAFAAALLQSAQMRRSDFQFALKTRIGRSLVAVSPGSKGVRLRLTRSF